MKVVLISFVVMFFSFCVQAKHCQDSFVSLETPQTIKKTKTANHRTLDDLIRQVLEAQEVGRQNLKQFLKDKEEHSKRRKDELVSKILEMTEETQDQIKRIIDIVVTLEGKPHVFYKVRKALDRGIDKAHVHLWFDTLIIEYKYFKRLTDLMIQAMGNSRNLIEDHWEGRLVRNQKTPVFRETMADSIKSMFDAQNLSISRNTQSIIKELVDGVITVDFPTRKELTYFANYFNRLFEQHLIWEEGERQRKLQIRDAKLNSVVGRMVSNIIDQQMLSIQTTLLQSYDYTMFHSHHSTDVKLVNGMKFTNTLGKVRGRITKDILISWSREDILRINTTNYKDTIQLELKRAVDRSQAYIIRIIFDDLKTHSVDIRSDKNLYFKADQWKWMVEKIVKQATPIIQSLLADEWQRRTY